MSSKINIFFFSLSTFVLLGGFLGFSVDLFQRGVEQLNSGEHWTETPIWPAVIVLLIGLLLYYAFISRWQHFRITSQGILISRLFKSEFVSWNDVMEIQLTGKAVDSVLGFPQELEAATLVLKKGGKKSLFAHYYRNFPQTRQVLEVIHSQILKGESVRLPAAKKYIHHSRRKLRNFDFLKVYKDHFFRTTSGIILLIILAYCILMLSLKNGGEVPIGLIMVAISLFYGFMGFYFHYFLMDDQYLVIRNQLWFFIGKQYQLVDIKEIVLEDVHRQGWCLRVITKDYQSRSFSSSVKTKTWLSLLQDLERKGMPIRNEIQKLQEAKMEWDQKS